MGNVPFSNPEGPFIAMIHRRILILRPDNIGDVILFSGALQHIRHLYSDAHITLAVQAHILNLVELCPYIDKCIPVDHLTWWGLYKNIRYPRLKPVIHGLNRLWNSISPPYDIVIYPVKSPDVSNLETIYCLHAKQIFGISGCTCNTQGKPYPSKYSPEVLFTGFLDVSSITSWTHEFFITLEFLRYLGCGVSSRLDIKPQIWLSDKEKNWLEQVQRDGRKIIGLFPGASYKRKCWEPGNYGKIAELLKQYKVIYVIFGSLVDKVISDRAEQSIRAYCADADILNLTGQTTLRELVKSISSCDIFISMDTSGLHVAIAKGVSTIGIVGGGHFGRFVPWGDPAKNIFITHEMDCFHCNWACTQEEVECIAGVSPHDVASAAINLLEH